VNENAGVAADAGNEEENGTAKVALDALSERALDPNTEKFREVPDKYIPVLGSDMNE
jgi:hypothetical protein